VNRQPKSLFDQTGQKGVLEHSAAGCHQAPIQRLLAGVGAIEAMQFIHHSD
jgi:hypothetical protein